MYIENRLKKPNMKEDKDVHLGLVRALKWVCFQMSVYTDACVKKHHFGVYLGNIRQKVVWDSLWIFPNLTWDVSTNGIEVPEQHSIPVLQNILTVTLFTQAD